MSDERTYRVEGLFHRARELEPDDRREWLARECAGDAELAAEVESLLHAGARAGDFMLRSRDPAEHAFDAGVRIGRWRLVREIASGGMGTVFLAERADGEFEQRVALKLIRGVFGAHALDGELARRFLAERQHLAHLEHPHVAKLLDGGTTDDGTPYLVMEFVAGEAIVEFCELRSLPLRARLELFRHVCLAVQYVHSKLIAHRDLKPSNILVAEGPTPSDAPIPKLLDFGIAKLLASDAAATATLGAQRLTPAYASPEQFKNEPITTASDVYSLGVILYELVTGRLPHPTEGATPIVLARAVCEAQPPSPRSVRASVKPELETIVFEGAREGSRAPLRERRRARRRSRALQHGPSRARAAREPRLPPAQARRAQPARVRIRYRVRARDRGLERVARGAVHALGARRRASRAAPRRRRALERDLALVVRRARSVRDARQALHRGRSARRRRTARARGPRESAPSARGDRGRHRRDVPQARRVREGRALRARRARDDARAACRRRSRAGDRGEQHERRWPRCARRSDRRTPRRSTASATSPRCCASSAATTRRSPCSTS